MHLVALLCRDLSLCNALSRFRDEALNFYLHPVSDASDLPRVLGSLSLLDFAGALVLEPELQRPAFHAAAKHSLDAQEVEAADALIVTPSGLIAEYNLGRAVGAALGAASWHGAGASVVILGAGVRARAVSRELSSLGATRLAVLAANRPIAERTTPQLAATTEIVHKAEGDPLAARLLEGADLIVRVDPTMKVSKTSLGPHLTIVDLSPEPMSALRQSAVSLGALTLGLRDVQAQGLALSLGHILGGRLGAERFSELLHTL